MLVYEYWNYGILYLHKKLNAKCVMKVYIVYISTKYTYVHMRACVRVCTSVRQQLRTLCSRLFWSLMLWLIAAVYIFILLHIARVAVYGFHFCFYHFFLPQSFFITHWKAHKSCLSITLSCCKVLKMKW